MQKNVGTVFIEILLRRPEKGVPGIVHAELLWGGGSSINYFIISIFNYLRISAHSLLVFVFPMFFAREMLWIATVMSL